MFTNFTIQIRKMKLEKHPQAKALIFDLDGTLSDSLPVHLATWNKVCAHFNCHFNEKIIDEMTGMPTIRFAERVIAENNLKGVHPEEIVRMKQEAFWESAALLKPYPVVVQLVYQYHGVLPMAVGTGASYRSAMVQLEQLKLTEYFDAIVTADDVSHHKPDPETFLKCAELLRTAPSDCQVFEDGSLGMRAAWSAGMILTDVRPYTLNESITSYRQQP
jgi:beta-phosphoglucomutase-like phosphatase (HAD superfamily)